MLQENCQRAFCVSLLIKFLFLNMQNVQENFLKTILFFSNVKYMRIVKKNSNNVEQKKKMKNQAEAFLSWLSGNESDEEP